MWLPLLVTLFIFAYPAFPPPQRARNQVHHQLTQFAGEVRQAAEQGNPWHCTSGQTTTLSPYGRAGERLFYQRVCLAADRPPASLRAPSAPGTIFIGTGPDEQVVWIMATVLPTIATNNTMWLEDRSRKPIIVLAGERSLSEMDHRRAN